MIGLQNTMDSRQIVGTTIAHFRILEPLASGGMASVYRAMENGTKYEAGMKTPALALCLALLRALSQKESSNA